MFHKETSFKHEARKGVVVLFIITTYILRNHRDTATALMMLYRIVVILQCLTNGGPNSRGRKALENLISGWSN